jgi:hypothetical protein
MIKATYIDHMGSDLSVVNAARVSFGKVSDWNEPSMGKASGLSDRDAKLVRYLAVHKQHLSFWPCFLYLACQSSCFRGPSVRLSGTGQVALMPLLTCVTYVAQVTHNLRHA